MDRAGHRGGTVSCGGSCHGVSAAEHDRHHLGAARRSKRCETARSAIARGLRTCVDSYAPVDRGATVHALTSHTHHLPILRGLFYQALVVGVTIVVLTFVFLFIFAYLPPVDIPWRKVWIGSFVSAVLYERGQFLLSLYLGKMDARSPFADVGALLAVLIWLYFSAGIVLIGADFTKVLRERGLRRSAAGKRHQ